MTALLNGQSVLFASKSNNISLFIFLVLTIKEELVRIFRTSIELKYVPSGINCSKNWEHITVSPKNGV